MDRAAWRRPVSDEEARRRVAGRTRINAERQRAAERRRWRVRWLLALYSRRPDRLALVADELSISRATLWRDRRAIAAHDELLARFGLDRQH